MTPMSSVAPRHRYSYREYLALEQASNVRHEFFDGEIYAMAGGTPEHAALAASIIAALAPALRGSPCRAFTSDLRVRVRETGLATYPDVTVVRGDLERDPEDHLTVVNPTVVVEVTSDGTEPYDRAQKRAHYQRIPSLREYVLVSHRERLVEVWRRSEGEQWERAEARGSARIVLRSIGCSLHVDDLYTTALGPPARLP
jgi:Uma2 family endonuclease